MTSADDDIRESKSDHDILIALRADVRNLGRNFDGFQKEVQRATDLNLTKTEANFRFEALASRVSDLEKVNEEEAKDRKFYKQTAIAAIISNVVTLVLGALLALKLFGGHQ